MQVLMEGRYAGQPLSWLTFRRWYFVICRFCGLKWRNLWNKKFLKNVPGSEKYKEESRKCPEPGSSQCRVGACNVKIGIEIDTWMKACGWAETCSRTMLQRVRLWGTPVPRSHPLVVRCCRQPLTVAARFSWHAPVSLYPCPTATAGAVPFLIHISIHMLTAEQHAQGFPKNDRWLMMARISREAGARVTFTPR